MIDLTTAIYQLYPQVTHTSGITAYDSDENEVLYDLSAVTIKAQQNLCKAQAQAYLVSTDYMMTADYDKDTTEVKVLRATARSVIRSA